MSRIWIFGESRWHLAWSGFILSLAVIFGLVAGLSLSPRLAEAQAFKTLDEPVGMVFNYIEQDSAEAFEQVMERLGQVMAESENPERVQQASGWKVYKAIEPGPNNNILYVWFIDPTVPEADYSVAQILNEEVPNEVQSLYETFNGSFGLGQMPINLELVVDFGGVTP
ncbi:MAG: hypothetical protein VX262_00025 [Acidobacteriota bacterium]|nr:hypothetical protein [Acidobacteriota bacterium]|tara:strand:- start:1137 stop:1640 length:504 start_codon:yes stop_codon:yes gene_type:complete